MLALGVLATLAANADFGSSHSAAGVIISAWPGIAFVGSAEVALGMVRKLPNPRPRGYARRSPGRLPLGSRRAFLRARLILAVNHGHFPPAAW